MNLTSKNSYPAYYYKHVHEFVKCMSLVHEVRKMTRNFLWLVGEIANGIINENIILINLPFHFQVGFFFQVILKASNQNLFRKWWYELQIIKPVTNYFRGMSYFHKIKQESSVRNNKWYADNMSCNKLW